MKTGVDLADKNALRRKNMIKQYGRGRVHLYRKGNVFHLLTEMYDPSPADLERFGEEVAYFRAAAGAGGWFTPEINLHPETASLRYRPCESRNDFTLLSDTLIPSRFHH
jgi:hypothetical protein